MEIKHVDIIAAIVAAIAAVASAYAALTLNSMEKTERSHEEILTAITAISAWSQQNTDTGGECAAMLGGLPRKIFIADVKIKRLSLDNEVSSDETRCLAGYKGERGANTLVLNENERRYVIGEVINQLNNYEVLALDWNHLGPEAKHMICQEAGQGPNSPYRKFEAVAQGTTWWKYPDFTKFLKTCIS